MIIDRIIQKPSKLLRRVQIPLAAPFFLRDFVQ